MAALPDFGGDLTRVSVSLRLHSEGADLDLRSVTTAKLAMDGEVEVRPVHHSSLAVQNRI